MHNPNNYIHYTDFGYDEYADQKKKRKIATISICIILFLLVLSFSFMGSCSHINHNFTNMAKDVNWAFIEVQSAMRSRLSKIYDLTKLKNEDALEIATIIGDVSQIRTNLESCTTPTELEAVNAEITNKLESILVLMRNSSGISESREYKNAIKQIDEAEEEVNTCKEEYNTIVSEYNELFGNFYARVIAKSYGFQTREMFEIS